MATTIDTIVDRVHDVLAVRQFQIAPEPFSFDRVPNQVLDRSYRVETEASGVLSGFNYTEERTDLVIVWVARTHDQDAVQAASLLRQDAATLRSDIIRDGAEDGGDYAVPDSGRGETIRHDPGRHFAVLRLALPVNYDATV
jgi:hypothetical protein